jgi:hypothetical protein
MYLGTLNQDSNGTIRSSPTCPDRQCHLAGVKFTIRTARAQVVVCKDNLSEQVQALVLVESPTHHHPWHR